MPRECHGNAQLLGDITLTPTRLSPTLAAPPSLLLLDAMKTALTAEQGAHGASEIVEKLKGRAAVFDLLNVTVSDAKVLLAALVAAL